MGNGGQRSKCRADSFSYPRPVRRDRQTLVMIHKIVLLVSLLLVGIAEGQTPAIIGGGYQDPSILSVAPGQLLTLFVTGIGKHLSSKPLTASAPLPLMLGGITVTLHQSSAPGTVSAPISAAVLTSTCQSLRNTPCAGTTLAAITVQIPFELAVGSPQDPSQRSEAILNIQEDGVSSTDFLVAAVNSNIHFVTGAGPLALDYVSQASIHGAIVMHTDGNPVLPGLPAKPGETLTVYGYGFGRPTDNVKTGEAPQAANLVPLYGSVLFSSLLPASPGTASGNIASLDSLQYISYVGVTPNSVGVYQMNFVVPPVPAGTPSCGGITDWNFMVTVGSSVGPRSFAFCVEP